MTTAPDRVLPAIVEAIHAHQRFVVSSHSRPDGDAIGSAMALAYALRALGKHVRVVNRDPAPPSLAGFPGVDTIEVADAVAGDYDVAVVMECGDLARTGVSGLDRGLVINIDHHPGNSGYGALNWFDASAAACAELVFELVTALDVPLSLEIATHIYVAILTDTGGFHYSGISPRTFAIGKAALEAGVDAVAVARAVFDNNSLSRLRLLGAVLNGMELAGSGRIAVLRLDDGILAASGATLDDADGLINVPLTVGAIAASIFLKHVAGDEYRVSLRSKGAVDVAAVARAFGGGGHMNAAGCTIHGAAHTVAATLVARIDDAIDRVPQRPAAD